MIEIWKPIATWPRYEVSNMGRVRRLNKDYRVAAFKIRKPVEKAGTLRVHLKDCGRHQNLSIGDLVAAAFLATPFQGVALLNYKDGNQHNNAIGNLEYIAPKIRACVICGDPALQRHQWKYCSRECALEGARAAIAAGVIFRSELNRICERCGKVYRRRNVKINNRFCSRACTLIPRKHCIRCGESFRPAAKQSNSAWYRRTGEQKFCSFTCANTIEQVCKQCSGSYIAHRKQGFCCLRCQKKFWLINNRARGAMYSQNRKARVRKAFVEAFQPVDIFARDGWRCQLCKSLVRRDKKPPHPRAPTIDHIVPISLGGVHSRANTQCAHFKCNIKKGVKVCGSQLRLPIQQGVTDD
jgi:5-methylcytosine-specific restriction endonuclease McrA